MKYIGALFTLTILLLFAGCSKNEKPLFSGRVTYVYYTEYNGSVSGFTRFDKGLPGTSTSINEDVWVDVYSDWIAIRLKNRNDSEIIIPKERVQKIIVGTKKENELNIPK
jgi:hypothetical protein